MEQQSERRHDHTNRSQRPYQPGKRHGCSSHRLLDPVSCSFCHDITLQEYRLLSVTTAVTRTTSEHTLLGSDQDQTIATEDEKTVPVSFRNNPLGGLGAISWLRERPGPPKVNLASTSPTLGGSARRSSTRTIREVDSLGLTKISEGLSSWGVSKESR